VTGATKASCALITGGLGFIGSYIARRLLKDQRVDHVVLVDHYGGYVSPLSEEYIDYRKLRISGIEDQIVIERAVTNYANTMTKLLLKYRPDYIFHLAALPLATLDNMSPEEAVEGTIVSTTCILEACDMLKHADGYEPRRFVYASSSMVYGDFQWSPASETHPTNPKNIYGAMKLAGEIVTHGLSRAYGIRSAVVRPSAVFGPTDMNRRVSQLFLENAMCGRRLTVHGENEALDFTYVEDAAKGFVLAATADQAVGETFNITAGEAHTLIAYVQVLREHFPELEYHVVERDASTPQRGTLSIEKARRMLGFEPEYSFRAGINAYVDFVRAHHPRRSPQNP
jgi:UDP-glucose 4-epimerase